MVSYPQRGRKESSTTEFMIELAKLEEHQIGTPLFRHRFRIVVETYLNFRNEEKVFALSLSDGIQAWAKKRTDEQMEGGTLLKLTYINMVYLAVEGYIAHLLNIENNPERIYEFINDHR